MKKTTLILTMFLAITNLFAQSPNSFKYQTVVRDFSGNIMENHNVSFQFSILQASATGTAVYTETHAVTTNEFGLVNLNIGAGTTSDDFSAIDWSNGPYFIKVELDENGGTAFAEMGTAQLLSVPYAMYAKDVANKDDDDADPNNELQTIDKTGNTVTLSDGGGSFTDEVDDADNSATNELQVLNFSNDTLYLDNGGQVYLGEYSSLWGQNDTNIYYNNGWVGVGTETPSGMMVVQGDEGVNPDSAIFEVKNKEGQTIFAVYDGGVRIWVDDTGAKANTDKGGFAVGGYRLNKSISSEYLRVTPDSVRVYIREDDGTKANTDKGGFAVGGYRLNKSTPSQYFNINANLEADTLNPSEARIYWYPLKEAFMSGRVLVESADSVGLNSWASGYESKSIGDYSQALGYKARAFGENSTAIGYEANSDGLNAIAFGNNVHANGNSSVAIGYEAVASGIGSMAIGCVGLAYSDGVYHLVDAPHAINDHSYAFGMGCLASGKSSFAFGIQTEASFHNATAFGYKTKSISYTSTSMGYETKASGYYSTSTGFNTIAKSYNEFVVGRYNDTTISNTTSSWVDSEPLFIIGNGDEVTSHNAMMVLKNGNVGINTNSPEAPLDIETNSSGYALHIEESGTGTEEWQLGVNSLGDLNFFDGTTIRAVFKDYGYLGIGTTAPGSHRLSVASGVGGTSGSTGFFSNTSSSGLALIVENSSNSSSDNTLLVSQKGTGDIVSFDSYHGTGSWDREFKFTNNGDGRCDGSWIAGGADYAEFFPKADINTEYEVGDIITMSPNKTYTVEGATKENAQLIIGVYSSNPAIVGNAEAEKDPENSVLVGMVGVIKTKVNTENGAIKIGDYITISSTPKVGMKATKNCMIVGRAMDNYDSEGTGIINVLVETDWYYNTEEGNITSSEIKNTLNKQQSDIEILKAEIEQLKQILEINAEK